MCDQHIVERKSGDLKFLTCLGREFWYNEGEAAVKGLLIRDCYEDLYRLWAAGNGEVVEFVGGASGIGKSTFIWYALYRLLVDRRKERKPLTVVWIRQTQCVYELRSDGSCLWVDPREPEFPRSADFCFIDMGAGFEVPNVEGLTSLVDSVRSMRTLLIASYKSELAALPKLVPCRIVPQMRRYMPVWTYEEMRAAFRHIFDIFREERLQALYQVFGGSFFLCLKHAAAPANAPRSLKGLQKGYLAACRRFIAFLKTSAELKAGGIPDEVATVLMESGIKGHFTGVVPVFEGNSSEPVLRGAGSLLSHMASFAPHYWVGNLRVSSRFCEYFIAAYRKRWKLDIKSLFSHIGGGAVSGWVHEFVGHGHLTEMKTRKYSIRTLKPPGQKGGNKRRKPQPKLDTNQLSLRVKSIAAFNSETEIGEIKDNLYGRPVANNFPVIDFVIQPNILGNFTVSNDHPLESTARQHLITQRGLLHEADRSKHLFLWVVPNKAACLRFKYQPGFYTGSAKDSDPIPQAVIYLAKDKKKGRGSGAKDSEAEDSEEEDSEEEDSEEEDSEEEDSEEEESEAED